MSYPNCWGPTRPKQENSFGHDLLGMCYFANWYDYLQERFFATELAVMREGRPRDYAAKFQNPVFRGDRLPTYQPFEYKWLYTHIHKLADTAEVALYDWEYDCGSFNIFYSSWPLDPRVRVEGDFQGFIKIGTGFLLTLVNMCYWLQEGRNALLLGCLAAEQ